MNRGEPILRAAASLVLVALGLMMVCVGWFGPRTMVLFMSVGLLCGGVGIVFFLWYVISDLRSRGAL
jgi:nitrogen fixation-related uncharacterized protein